MRSAIMMIVLTVAFSYVPCTYAEGEIEMNWADLKCHMQGGQWRIGEKTIEVYNIDHRDIYKSPQEPSFVSWVNLWKEADGTLKCAFIEATGDPAMWPPAYNFNRPGMDYYIKTLLSRDNGATWTDTGWDDHYDSFWDMNPDHHWRRTVVMPDGSLLRILGRSYGNTSKTRWLVYDESLEGKEHEGYGRNFPFRKEETIVHPRTTTVERSADGGQTWQEVTRSVVTHNSCLLRCRDGRLVVTGFRSGGVVVWESLDDGHSWSDPCVVVPAEGEFKDVRLGNENEIVELSDGRLLLVCRTDNAPRFVEGHLTRTGPGQYEAADVKFGPMPHSGYPFLLQCSDGVIWYAGHGSHFVTLDEGITWKEHRITGSYYPQMVEIEPGSILNITHYGCADSSFPHPRDVSIRQTRFDYRRADVLEQNDAETPLALSIIDRPPTKDTHLHAWVRADGYSGLAFRIQSDGADYYVYMLQMEFPENGEAEAGEKLDAFHLLGRVTDGQLTVLRRRYIGEVALGAWLQIRRPPWPHLPGRAG